MPKVSIIVITHNAEEHLSRSVDSILKETRGGKVEIRLVDNGSSDRTREIATSLLTPNNCIFQENNLGFSKALNIGIKKTTGEYILVMNPDVFLEKGALRNLTCYLDEHPNVAAVGPKHHYPDGRLQLTWGWKPTIAREWLRRKCQYGLRQGDEKLTSRMEFYSKAPLKVDWLAGSCLLFRRSVNEKIGGWDERFFLFFEDIDWGVRAREASYDMVLFPEALVRHVEGGSAGKRPKATERIYRESQRLFVDKHWGLVSRIFIKTYLGLKRS